VALLAYLDNAATTPVLPEARAAVLAAMGEEGAFANPSSVHRWGLAAAETVAAARRAVARLLGAREGEIIFTSGGTESNHLALLGAARALRRRGRHLLTTAIEHSSILRACAALEEEGWEVTRLAPGADGRVGPEEVRAALRPDTVLCALGHVNNELGSVQPVAEIAAALSAAGVLLHVDGVQALGKVPTPYAAWGVGLAALSAHKIGGPKGAGALYVRAGVRLVPPVGGEQERGLRPGTENVPGIAGFGAAAALAAEPAERLRPLKLQLLRGLQAALPGLQVNGPDPADPTVSAPHILNLSFAREAPGVPAEVLLHAFEEAGVACSAGSACSARRPAPSHVLAALGLPAPRLRGSLRFSLGPQTDAAEVAHAVRALPAAVAALAGELAR
jgi:cysteine desulfurase